MPKDYAHLGKPRSKKNSYRSSRSRYEPRRSIPWRAFVLLVLILVAVIVGIVVVKNKVAAMNEKNHAGAPVETAIQTTPVKQVQAKKSQDDDNQDVNFDFYKMLPQMKVDVSNESNENAIPAGSVYYLVQVASLKDIDQANRFKERLQLLGFDPKVMTIPRGDVTWYRVQLGPFSDKSAAEDKADLLEQQNIVSIVIAIHKKDVKP